MNKEYTIVTISNRTPMEWYYLQRQLYTSLEGYDVMTIKPEYWKGLATKPKVLYDTIKRGLISTKYMQFVDNWDLVYGATPDEVHDVYMEFESPIVISAEKNCFPDTYKKEFDDIGFPTMYRYVNSGVIVGETEAILACLEAMDLPNVVDDHWDNERNCNYHSNDQTMWQEIFLKQPVKISLDYSMELSQTLHDADPNDFKIEGGRLMNKITGSSPCIWHFNGGSKDKPEIRNPILTHLNLI